MSDGVAVFKRIIGVQVSVNIYLVEEKIIPKNIKMSQLISVGQKTK